MVDSRCSDNDLTAGMNLENSVEGSKGLLKWKGVVFTPEDGVDTATSPDESISQITEVDNTSNQVSTIKAVTRRILMWVVWLVVYASIDIIWPG